VDRIKLSKCVPIGYIISICICGSIVNLKIIESVHMKTLKPIDMICDISLFKLCTAPTQTFTCCAWLSYERATVTLYRIHGLVFLKEV